MLNRRMLVAAVMAVALLLPALSAQAEEPVNVNTATQEQLIAVPGLSPELAQAIIKYREEMGDIQNLDELTEIPGISKDLLGKIKPYLSLDAISGAECSC